MFETRILKSCLKVIETEDKEDCICDVTCQPDLCHQNK